MIENAEQTVIEFRRRVVEALRDEHLKYQEHKLAVRKSKEARKALDVLLDRMADPQMPLPFDRQITEDRTLQEAADDHACDPASELPELTSANGDTSSAADGETDWHNKGIEILFDHGVTAPDARCLKKAGLHTFGKLIDFTAGGHRLDSLPGIGAKSADRVNAAILAWADANPA